MSLTCVSCIEGGSHRSSRVTADRRSISEMPLYGGSLLVVSPSSSRTAHSATVHQEQRIVTSVSCSASSCHAHRGGQEGREAGSSVEKGTLEQLSMRETKSGKTRSEKRKKEKEQLVTHIRGWTPNGLFRTTRVRSLIVKEHGFYLFLALL